MVAKVTFISCSHLKPVLQLFNLHTSKQDPLYAFVVFFIKTHILIPSSSVHLGLTVEYEAQCLRI